MSDSKLKIKFPGRSSNPHPIYLTVHLDHNTSLTKILYMFISNSFVFNTKKTEGHKTRFLLILSFHTFDH